jgi:hypothetical protein
VLAIGIGIGRAAAHVLGVLELPSIARELVIAVELSHLIIGRPCGSLLRGSHGS